ncbi:MAG: flavodoxin [Corynebacterium sp.]|nr:flavodoxin [Corynebacterium sp.]
MTTSPYLVAYFSVTGTTEAVAHKLAGMVEAEEFRIAPAVEYLGTELRGEPGTRIHGEQTNPDARPETNGERPVLEGREVLFLGYPIWFGIEPRIISSFIEENREALKGITIMPFATAGDAPISDSLSELRHLYPELDIQDGPVIHPGKADEVLEAWMA